MLCDARRCPSLPSFSIAALLDTVLRGPEFCHCHGRHSVRVALGGVLALCAGSSSGVRCDSGGAAACGSCTRAEGGFDRAGHLAAARRRPDMAGRRARTEDAVSAHVPYLAIGEVHTFIHSQGRVGRACRVRRIWAGRHSGSAGMWRRYVGSVLLTLGKRAQGLWQPPI